MLRSFAATCAASLTLACGAGRHEYDEVAPRTVTEARKLDDKAVDDWDRSNNRTAIVAYGHLIPASSVEEAAAALSKMSPRPIHAYLLDASRPRIDHWEMLVSYGDVSVIGIDALSNLIDEVAIDPEHRQVTFSKDGRSTTIKYAGNVPVIRFRISPASRPSQSKDVNLLVASGFAAGVFLKASDAVDGALETSEEPGVTTLSVAGFDATLSCRRAVAWIELPELKSRGLVSVAYQDVVPGK